MIKSRGPHGTALVTFTLSRAVGASQAAVCGEWNDWSADRDIMAPANGGFTRTIELNVGRAYRFRYLLDGHRWENDWAADAYVPNDYGGDDSVVDLTALAEETPPAVSDARAEAATKAAAKAPTRRASTRKAASTGGTATAKKATTAEGSEPKKAARKSQPADKATRAKRTSKKQAP